MSSREARALALEQRKREQEAAEIAALKAAAEPPASSRKKKPSASRKKAAQATEGQPQLHAETSDVPAVAVVSTPAEVAALRKQLAEERSRLAAQEATLNDMLAQPQSSPQDTQTRSARTGAAAQGAAAAAAAATESQQEQSRFARKEPRTQDLREYDGAAGDKLDAWLDELQLARMLYELNIRETAHFVVSRLRGAALQWWLALSSSQQAAFSNSSVEALAAALRVRFQPQTAAHTARVQLDKLAQGSRSVNDYIADFQRLHTRLPDMAEADALHAFKRGLRSDIAHDLRKQRIVTLTDAISLAAHIGSDGAAPKQSLNQMEIDDGAGASEERIVKAVLNAMHGRDTSGLGAKTQTHMGYTQQRDSQRGGRGGSHGGRGGRGGFGQRGPPAIPGVPEHVVRQRLNAQQCMRCGEEGHRALACPNAISARGN